MVKPFFRGSPKKWLPDSRMAKMVTTGRLLMHLQRAPEMSRQWGPAQALEKIYHPDSESSKDYVW